MEGACSDTDKSVLSKVKFGVFLRNGGVEAWQQGAACRFSSDQPSSTEQPKRAGLPQLPAEEPPSTFTAASKRGPPHTPEATASPLPPRLHEGPGKAPRSPGTGAAAPARRLAPEPEATAPPAGAGRCGRGRSAAPGAGGRPAAGRGQPCGQSPGRGRGQGDRELPPGGNGEGEKSLTSITRMLPLPLLHALKSPEIAAVKEIPGVLEACQ